MQTILQSYQKQAGFIIVLWMIGMLISAEVLMSLPMITLLLMAIFEWDGNSFGFRKKLKHNWQQLTKDKTWLIATIPFLLVVFTAPFSNEDLNYLWERIRIKIPFLVLPFAFISIPQFSKKSYYNLLYIFLILTSLCSLGVLFNYLSNFEEINILISQGQAIPTPCNHIRFSLMVAYSIIIGVYLFFKQHHFKFRWEKWCLGGLALFLFIFIHVLAVRSGLAVFYLASSILIFRYIFLSKKYVLGGWLIIGLLSAPFIAYHTIPSIKTKIAYMKYDYFQSRNQDAGRGYSDSERIMSLQMASNIIKEHSFLGVGAGDLKHEMQQQYAQHYPDIPREEQKMPHNEYISILAGTGIIGLFFFLIFCVYPIIHNKNYQEPLFFAFLLILLFSFLVENTIENALGVALCTLFLLLGLNTNQK